MSVTPLFAADPFNCYCKNKYHADLIASNNNIVYSDRDGLTLISTIYVVYSGTYTLL